MAPYSYKDVDYWYGAGNRKRTRIWGFTRLDGGRGLRAAMIAKHAMANAMCEPLGGGLVRACADSIDSRCLG